MGTPTKRNYQKKTLTIFKNLALRNFTPNELCIIYKRVFDEEPDLPEDDDDYKDDMADDLFKTSEIAFKSLPIFINYEAFKSPPTSGSGNGNGSSSRKKKRKESPTNSTTTTTTTTTIATTTTTTTTTTPTTTTTITTTTTTTTTTSTNDYHYYYYYY